MSFFTCYIFATVVMNCTHVHCFTFAGKALQNDYFYPLQVFPMSLTGSCDQLSFIVE